MKDKLKIIEKVQPNSLNKVVLSKNSHILMYKQAICPK